MSKLLSKLRRQETLEAAWRVVQENARTSTSKEVRQEIDDFAQAPGKGIRSISHRLSRNKFEFKPAKGILSPKKDSAGRKTGKVRPIVLAPLESRIVQRALLDVLVALPSLESYSKTPFSFGGVRKAENAASISAEEALSGVPAAVRAALEAINSGATHFACADIKGFFTRISKRGVLGDIGAAVQDPSFMSFLEKAIETELSNLADLRQRAEEFPIEDIGVAQGSSLSTLLGNIALNKFDLEMNSGGCRCIRYIDDFIIFERTQRAANAQLRKAKRLLKELDMELSPEKSSSGASPISRGLTFLGIQIVPGYIRPTAKKRDRFVSSVAAEFAKSRSAFSQALRGKSLSHKHSLVATLMRIDGMIDAWGKAYWYCNDTDFFRRTDEKIRKETQAYLGAYRAMRERADQNKRDGLLGITKLSEQRRNPFRYPVIETRRSTPAASP